MSQNRDRRQFFRESFYSIMKPVAEFLAERIEIDLPVQRTVLRPPGALAEAAFLEVCFRCGNCVEECPADAIRLLASDDEELNNTPIVDPDLSACVICDELACMKGCPSGALKLVDSPLDIRMGLALVSEQLCIRTSGEDCTECIDRCPVGETAIRLGEKGEVEVLEPGCVGCGVCQFHCPTQPKAITVSPL